MKTRIEIIVTANGYLVLPEFGRNESIQLEQAHTFETFDSLVDHLKANIVPEKSQPTPEPESQPTKKTRKPKFRF